MTLAGSFNHETPGDINIYSTDPGDGHCKLVNHSWPVMVLNAGTPARQTATIAICTF